MDKKKDLRIGSLLYIEKCLLILLGQFDRRQFLLRLGLLEQFDRRQFQHILLVQFDPHQSQDL